MVVDFKNDLDDTVVFLIEQALKSWKERREQLGVNMEGYYFVQAGEVSLIERAEGVNKRLGFKEVERVPVDVAAEIHPFGPLMWGCGARFRADKLRKLGWKPNEVDWRTLMEEEGEKGRRRSMMLNQTHVCK